MADKGYTEPTPIQAQSIPAILEGKDVYGGAQTGTGKTASFTLPLLQKNTRKSEGGKRVVQSLILVPTRELATQVGESVRGYGAHLKLKIVIVAGGMPMRMQIRTIEKGVDVIIATPGRLLDLIKRKTISLLHLNTLVLDEADRMLDMGFMPDIRKILMHVPPKRQTLMFSATTSKEIERLAATILKNPLRVQVGEQNQVADNVSHTVYFVRRQDKADVISELFKNDEFGQVLIFTRTRGGADDLKDLLTERNLTAKVIHGGKAQSVRTQTLKRFKTGKFKILIATDVAARGLDIDSLPHVVNYELPQAPDDYIHRIGRTGRAGNQGHAISLVSQTERHSLIRIEQKIKKHFKREKIEGIQEVGAVDSKSRDKRFNPFKGGVRPGAKRKYPAKKGASEHPRRTYKSDDKKPFKKPWDKKKPESSEGRKKPFTKTWDKKAPAQKDTRSWHEKQDDKKPFKKSWDKKDDKKPFKKPWDKKDDKKPFKKPWDKKDDKKPFKKPWDKKDDKKKFPDKKDDKKPFKKPWDKKKSSDTDKKKFSAKKPWDKKDKFSGATQESSDKTKAFPSKKQKKSFKKMWDKDKKDSKDSKESRHPQKKTGFEKFYKKGKKNRPR